MGRYSRKVSSRENYEKATRRRRQECLLYFSLITNKSIQFSPPPSKHNAPCFLLVTFSNMYTWQKCFIDTFSMYLYIHMSKISAHERERVFFLQYCRYWKGRTHAHFWLKPPVHHCVNLNTIVKYICWRCQFWVGRESVPRTADSVVNNKLKNNSEIPRAGESEARFL